MDGAPFSFVLSFFLSFFLFFRVCVLMCMFKLSGQLADGKG